jgi:hypothetical protein
MSTQVVGQRFDLGKFRHLSSVTIAMESGYVGPRVLRRRPRLAVAGDGSETPMPTTAGEEAASASSIRQRDRGGQLSVLTQSTVAARSAVAEQPGVCAEPTVAVKPALVTAETAAVVGVAAVTGAPSACTRASWATGEQGGITG